MKYLNPIQQSRDIVQEFRGYNHNIRINEGEFYDEENLSSDYYPVMAPSKRRGPVSSEGVDGICALGDDVYYTKCYLSSGQVIKKLYRLKRTGESTDTELFDFTSLSSVPQNVPRQLVQMGAYIVIFPDGVYYNTSNTQDKGSINATFQSSTNYDCALCDENGNIYQDNQDYTCVVGASPPSSSVYDHDDNLFWLKIDLNRSYLEGASTPELYRYSVALAGWQSVDPVYVKVEASGIADGFTERDAVSITETDTSASPNIAGWIDGQRIIQGVHTGSGNDDSDAVWFEGIIDSFGWTYTGVLAMGRKAPVMDFVVESNNRLWGCRYGNNNDGDFVNELYASKLGDFKNWNCFEGISTDSYAASVGTYGPFTGAISYLGYPLFFKETCLHKVYGNMPSNFQINALDCSGVAYGAGNSLAIVDARLYYKSVDGVRVYDGSIPVDISAALGHTSYNNAFVSTTIPASWKTYYDLRAGASGGSHKHLYYLYCMDALANKRLFVYDTRLGIWHKEHTSVRIACFADTPRNLYFVQNPGYGVIYRISDEIAKDTEWYAETGEIGMLLPNMQYISRITLKMAIALGASASVAIQYDGAGEWEHITTVSGNGAASYTIPIQPRRCMYFRLRFSGIGDVKLFGYIKTTELGSDI